MRAQIAHLYESNIVGLQSRLEGLNQQPTENWSSAAKGYAARHNQRSRRLEALDI